MWRGSVPIKSGGGRDLSYGDRLTLGTHTRGRLTATGSHSDRRTLGPPLGPHTRGACRMVEPPSVLCAYYTTGGTLKSDIIRERRMRSRSECRGLGESLALNACTPLQCALTHVQ